TVLVCSRVGPLQRRGRSCSNSPNLIPSVTINAYVERVASPVVLGGDRVSDALLRRGGLTAPRRLGFHCPWLTLRSVESRLGPRGFERRSAKGSPCIHERAPFSFLTHNMTPAVRHLSSDCCLWQVGVVSIVGSIGAARPSPNPSIEGTSTSKLRLLAAAPH